MAKYIIIERPNNIITIVRKELETGSEDTLTEHEEIINELFERLKIINDMKTLIRLKRFLKQCWKQLQECGNSAARARNNIY